MKDASFSRTTFCFLLYDGQAFQEMVKNDKNKKLTKKRGAECK